MRLEDLAQPTMLASFFRDVRRRSQAAGIDGVTPDAYARDLSERLEHLGAALRSETWRPSRLLRIQREKPGGGIRRLSIPTIEERIIIEGLRRAFEPSIEPLLSDATFAYRPRRSARLAVDAVAQSIEQGAAWAALADIRDFFDTVPLEAVTRTLHDVPCDPAVMRLLGKLLESHALRPGRGLAQGSALSPLLSNLVLMPLDRRLLAAGFDLVRYCDNMCITIHTKAAAELALAAMGREITRLGLLLKPSASRVAEVREGLLWLGFWLDPSGRRVSDGAVQALRGRVEAAGRGLEGAQLRACLLPIVRGWVQYFDAPLPEGVSLGEYDRLTRDLIAECALQPAEPAGPESSHDAAGGGRPLVKLDDDAEPWDDAALQAAPLPSVGSGEVDRLLGEADNLAVAGSYALAEAAYEAAQRIATAPVPALEAPRPPEPLWDEETIDTFIGLFGAGQDTFETAPLGSSERRDFTVVQRPPTPADVRDHLAGRSAMAVRPRLSDGTCTLGVIDIDAIGPLSSVAARAHAEALASVAREWGWSVLIETTGGSGAHVWVPVAARMRADDMARALESLEREAGTPSEGVRVERLPGSDAAPDVHMQAMTLPLGVHVETGTKSRLRWGSGTEIDANLAGLFEGSANDSTLLLQHSTVAPTSPKHGDRVMAVMPDYSQFGRSVAQVMAGCAVLRHLAGKAAAVGHLNHAERLSILYSLGHLGTAGTQAIHAIIGKCRNYDSAETSRQIGKLTGLPIGCTRMREKHATPELMPLCSCDFGDVRRRGGYPTPLLHAVGFRRSWRDMLRDRRSVEARRRAEGGFGVNAVPEDAFPGGSTGQMIHRQLQRSEAVSPPAAPAERSPASSQDEATLTGAILDCAPPHEWA